MRKFFGAFIAFIAVIFLGLTYAQLASAATEPKCGDAIAEKIAALVEKDHSTGKNILALQLKLTTMKLAMETKKKNKTVEGYFRHQEDLIKHLDTEGVQSSLVSLYNKYGEGEDVALVTARFTETLEKIEKASYFKPSTRFKNQDLSAYTLAHIMLHKEKSPYNKADVSVLWLQSNISEVAEAKSGRGSSAANLTEISTQIARLTGITGGNAMSVSELESSIQRTQADISSAFDKIALQYRDDLKKSCKEMETCATCAVTAKENALSESHKQDALVSLAKVMQQKVRESGGSEIKAESDAVVATLRKKGGTVERVKKPATELAVAGKNPPAEAPPVIIRHNVKVSRNPPVEVPVLVTRPVNSIVPSEVVDISTKPEVQMGLSRNDSAAAGLLHDESVVLVNKPRPEVETKFGRCTGTYQVTPGPYARSKSTLHFKFGVGSGNPICECSECEVTFRKGPAWNAQKIVEYCTKKSPEFKQLCGATEK